MADQTIYDATINSLQNDNGPTTKKTIVDVADNTNGDYSMSECIFETSSFSNNGLWADFYNGYLDFPMTMRLTGVNGTTAVDFAALKGADFALALKNNYDLIHSVQVDCGGTLFNSTDYINKHILYELHTKMDLNDEKVNGPTISYFKSSSQSWQYLQDHTSLGSGLINNVNIPEPHNSSGYAVKTNVGLFKSQQNYVNTTNTPKSDLLGTDAQTYIKAGNKVIVDTTTSKTYHFNLILRLRDLPFFKDFQMLSRGCNFKITLRLNTCSFKVEKDAAGALKFLPSTYMNRGGSNPVMFCASAFVTKHTTTVETVEAITSITNATPPVAVKTSTADYVKSATGYDAVYACGSKMLPANNTYTVQLSVGDMTIGASRKTARMYVPMYELDAEKENLLLQMPPKRLTYTQLYVKVLKERTGSIQELITPGLSQMQRVIILPMLSKRLNGKVGTPGETFDMNISPFMDSNVCPHILSNMNLKVAGEPLYKANIEYGYQMFLNEICTHSIHENQEMGLVTSRISQADYDNTYGYIVFDLRRRPFSEDNIKKSLEFYCDIKRPEYLDFLIFVEYMSSVSIDLKTGEIA